MISKSDLISASRSESDAANSANAAITASPSNTDLSFAIDASRAVRVFFTSVYKLSTFVNVSLDQRSRVGESEGNATMLEKSFNAAVRNISFSLSVRRPLLKAPSSSFIAVSREISTP